MILMKSVQYKIVKKRKLSEREAIIFLYNGSKIRKVFDVFFVIKREFTL